MWCLGRQTLLFGYDYRLFAMAFFGTMAGTYRFSFSFSSFIFFGVLSFLNFHEIYILFGLSQPAKDIEEVPDFVLPSDQDGEKMNVNVEPQ